MSVCVLLDAVVVATVFLKVLLQVITKQKEREWQPSDGQLTTETTLNGRRTTTQRFQRPSNSSHRKQGAAYFNKKVLFSSLFKRSSSEKKTDMTTLRSLRAPMGTLALTSQASLSEACDLRGTFRLRSEHPLLSWDGFPAVPALPCGFLVRSWARFVTYHLLDDYRVLDGPCPWLNFDKGFAYVGDHPQLPAQAS